MGKFIIGGLAIALALALNLGTPRPAAAYGHDCNLWAEQSVYTGSSGCELVNKREDVNTDTPGCQVCIRRTYKKGSEDKASFHFICTNSSIDDLSAEPRSGKEGGGVVGLGESSWEDAATSVTLWTDKCKQPDKAHVVLHQDRGRRGNAVKITIKYPGSQSFHAGGERFFRFKLKDIKREKGGGWGTGNWSQQVSSLSFSEDATNPLWGRQLGGCRVCLYDGKNYQGSFVCVKGGKSILKLKDSEHNFNDITESIDFQTTNCPSGKAITATLFDKDNGEGSQLFMDESNTNLNQLDRGWNKWWNDSISSLGVQLVSWAKLNCRVCVYEHVDYKGRRYCTDGPIGDLKTVNFNDMASSAKVYRKSCQGGGVVIYEDKFKKGKKEWFYDNKKNLGSYLNDKVSSLVFSPTLRKVVDSSLPTAAGANEWELVSGGLGSLDISVGAHGLVWIIAADKIPYTWTGTSWSKMGSKKGIRIDASAGGRAWMVGTDNFLYSWDPSRKTWKKEGTKKATDVGVSAGGGVIWIVGGDESDKKVRRFGNVNKNKPDAYKVYHRGFRDAVDKWTRGGGQNTYAIRVDVDMRGNAWVVEDQSDPSGYTRFWPRGAFTGPRPQVYGQRRQSDVSVGVGGHVVVLADNAPFFLKGTKWEIAHGQGLFSIAVDMKGNLWGITTKDLNNKSYPGFTRKIHAYGGAIAQAKFRLDAVKTAAAKKAGQEWRVVSGKKALDISTGPDGSAWIIDTNKNSYQWTGTTWFKRGSKIGTRIDVDPNGKAWMVGTDKFPYSWTGAVWEKQGNRQVLDVGVGGNGQVWAVGTDGFPYKWTGTAWQKKSGPSQLLRIDVGPKGNPWVVNKQGQVLFWAGRSWVSTIAIASAYLNSPAARSTYGYGPRYAPFIPANDISVGTNGKVMVAAKAGGTALWNPQRGWTTSGPNAKPANLTVDKNGNLWITTNTNVIHAVRDASKVKPPVPLLATNVAPAMTGGAVPPPVVAMGGTTAKTWQRTTNGLALDISAGPGGNLWIIGTDNSPYSLSLTDDRWTKKTGKTGTRIDVGAGGWLWMVGKDRYAYHWRSNKWNKLTGRTISDIAIGGGKAWAIGTDNPAGNHSIYRWTSQWTKISGDAVRIDVGPNGNAWVVNKQGQVYTRDGTGWKRRSSAPPATDISIGANGTVVIALKEGGTATWNGTGWSKTGPGANPANVAVGQNGTPWATIANRQIWAWR